MQRRCMLLRSAAAIALAIGFSLAAVVPTLAQEREIKVGYMKNPIQDASLDIMEKWAKANNVKLTRIPMAYSVFMEKVTATLTSGADQFDMIWHNDDWGQLWKKWLETTDDVKGIENADRWPLLAFWNDDKKLTTVPMAHTVGTFFYRTDLVKAEEVPKSFDELVKVSQRLQKEGKAKWGYVGGMSMNNTWFSFWWTMWANNCDILNPLFERDNEKLKAAKFEPAVTEPCHREIVEYWWDAINTHKISPPGMTAYGRNEANAIFMAGDAAFTLVDSTHFGEFSDPKRSKIVGKVGMAPFPVGPRAKVPTSWNEILGLGHSDRRAGRSQEARQGDAVRDDERRGRPGRNVEEDRWAAAERQAVAEAAQGGQGLRCADACGVRPEADHALGLLFCRVAGGAQSLLRHGHRRCVRQARRYSQGAAGPRRENPARGPRHQLV